MRRRPETRAKKSALSAAAGSPPILEEVAADYRAGKIDKLDVVRRYAVVLDWDSGALLPVSTGQFREMFHKRTAAAWAKG